MLGYRVERRKLGWKKIGLRYEFSTLSLVVWWFKTRYTIHRYRGGEDILIKMIRTINRLPWQKTAIQ